MNIFLYMSLFLIGIIVGNFWQRAIYRIPRNISIIKKGVTYIEPESKSKFLKKLVYIFYSLLGGTLFVIFGQILEIDINNLKISSIIMYLFTILYLTILVIVAGIDKKRIKIEKKIMTIGITISLIYIVYLYIVDPPSIYFNTICLAIYLILLTIDTILLRKYAKNSYTIGTLMLLNIILVFSETEIFAYTMVMVAIEILTYMSILQLNKKKNGNRKVRIDKVPVGYFISVSNIVILFLLAILKNIKI